MATIHVQPSLFRITVEHDGSNAVVVPLSDPGYSDQFVNAFATDGDNIIDNTVEISVLVFETSQDVTFTPPNSDLRFYHVMVMRTRLDEVSFNPGA